MNREYYIKQFYRISCFGREKDKVSAASRRSYRDLCRTIHFKDSINHDEAYKAVVENLRTEIRSLKHIRSQEDYDKWHNNICNSIVNTFKRVTEDDAPFSYGQAQKWVNMFMKYLIILEDDEINNVESFLHVPVDNIIIKTANIGSPGDCWSKLSDKQYLDYLEKLRRIIPKNETPIEWEFHSWADGQ